MNDGLCQFCGEPLAYGGVRTKAGEIWAHEACLQDWAYDQWKDYGDAQTSA